MNRERLKTGRAVILAAILMAGCSRPSVPQSGGGLLRTPGGPASADRLRFADHTETSRINFTYRSGAEPSAAPILFEVGGGCGLLDMDRDGCLDAFFPGGGFLSESGPQPHPHGFFQNLGDGSFRDVVEPSGVRPGRFYSHGVASADYDADGFPDLLVTGYGGLQLFHNQGDGTFSEQAERAGLTDRLWSSSAAWGDVNRDGHPDLYVCHYVDWSPENDPVCNGPTPAQPDSCPPDHFKGLPDTLYLSSGTGTFHDISKAAGLRGDGKGLGVVMADLDADGDVDIYVANDTVANFVYRNEGCESGSVPRFTEIGTESGAALSDSGTPDASMGIAILDLNQDSRPDLWVSNFEFETPGVYRNEGHLNFTHIARSAGVGSRTNSFVSFGTLAADFDGDGDDDVLVTNGHISRYPRNSTVLQPCQLFENLGGSIFRDVAARAGECLTKPRLGRGLAVGDIDGDGDPDAVLSPKDEPARVVKNTQTSVRRWLSVQLTGTISPRDGNGATVTLTRNGTRMTQWSYGGHSYLSSSSSSLCFPDDLTSVPLELEVAWPSGRIQRLHRPIAPAPQNWRGDCGFFCQASIGLIIIEPKLVKKAPMIDKK